VILPPCLTVAMASILCFGDSITQGFVDPDGGWTQRLRRRLDQDATIPMGDTTFPAHAVFNLGVSGDTTEGLAARLERELAPRQLGDQSIVVIAVGVNETAFDPVTGRPAHDAERFAATLAELVAAARRHTDRVLLVGLLPCDEARMQPAPWSEDGREHYANDRIGQFNQAVRRVAADTGVALADCFEELLAGDHTALLHDGLHPNGAGHQLLADRIGERLRRWL
jgi:lysophospholipase L1-like esterase